MKSNRWLTAAACLVAAGCANASAGGAPVADSSAAGRLAFHRTPPEDARYYRVRVR